MNVKKIYLAASYTRKLELKEYRTRLKDAGFKCTSSWLREHHDPKTQMVDVTPAFLQRTAKMDLKDIRKAQIVMVFTQIPIPRGGHVVETGIAIALGKKLIIVGPKENVFHYLPRVKRFDSFEGALVWLRKKYQTRDVR